MNKKILSAVAGAVAIAIGIGLFASGQFQSHTESLQKTSAYIEANSLLKQKLAEQNLQLSSPIKLSKPEDIEKYCSFFTDKQKQDLVQYCTSTELKDKDGNFLGNIHMVGPADAPKIVMVLIQVDPMMSQLDSVITAYDTTIKSLVCDCWSEKKPGNLDTVGQWVDGLRQFHLSDTKPHSKSNPLTLDGKSMQLELTTNQQGYLWQFFIYY